jgi:hypothetical protein
MFIQSRYIAIVTFVNRDLYKQLPMFPLNRYLGGNDCPPRSLICQDFLHFIELSLCQLLALHQFEWLSVRLLELW